MTGNLFIETELLQKKRLKQTDSSSCPACGMDPQDVPNCFNCIAHLTDMTPVSLWERPINTTRELSFLDARNWECTVEDS